MNKLKFNILRIGGSSMMYCIALSFLDMSLWKEILVGCLFVLGAFIQGLEYSDANEVISE